MRGLVTGFRQFVLRGNVLDLAVGIVVGAAFTGVSPAAPSPATKKCPACFTDIPLKASRCPNCTSELAPPGMGRRPSCSRRRRAGSLGR
jgi:Large-conductance mechanosensitive channel, MscL